MRGFARKSRPGDMLTRRRFRVGADSMGVKSIRNLEREFGHSYTENVSINTGDSNPHRKDALEMAGDRSRSLSLRRLLRMN